MNQNIYNKKKEGRSTSIKLHDKGIQHCNHD